MSWFDKRHQAKDAFLTLSLSKYTRGRRGRSSAVERQLPKLNVVGSTPIARSKLSHTACSFDRLVGAAEQRGRYRQAESLSRLQIDDHLEPGRLLHGKLAGLCALEDLVGEAREPDIEIGIVHRIGDQSAGFDEFARCID